MHRSHTTYLFYRRYTHYLRIDGAVGDDVLAWAGEQMPRRFRRYRRNRHAQMTLGIYCNRAEHDLIMATWGQHVMSVIAPLNNEAESLLLDGVRLNIREKPFYNRYRYAMRFYIKNNAQQELYSFIQSRLGKPGLGYKLVRSRWFPNLYLSNEAQLTMLRLSDPPARIIETVKVYTHRELEQAIR